MTAQSAEREECIDMCPGLVRHAGQELYRSGGMKMKKLFNRKGFSLAEMLVVVGIIVILMAVGFIGLVNYQRSTHQLEMDNTAKEIFVAAQNHLAMAESQGFLGIANDKFGIHETVAAEEGSPAPNDPGIYYFVVNNNFSSYSSTSLAQMLPYGSVDEAARTGGSYIIRYQKSPAVVLDVFYASREEVSKRFGHNFITDDYALALSDLADQFDDSGKITVNNKNTRRNWTAKGGAVVGWYGGVGAVSRLIGETLAAPSLVIENDETLRVIITDINNDSAAWEEAAPNSGKNSLRLVVSGENGELYLPLIDGGETPSDATTNPIYDRVDYDEYATDGRIVVTLDDVTDANLHFANLVASIGSLTPGEEIRVRAEAFNDTNITGIASSGTSVTNSLFASLGVKKDEHNNDYNAVEISHFRHLLNLDPDVSGIDKDNLAFAKAEQIGDLDWKNFKDDTHTKSKVIHPFNSEKDPSESDSYYPVNPGYALHYDGKAKKISNLAVTSADALDAGLFGELTNGSVSNLELIDFNISTEGYAGALAGRADGTEIKGVLVRTENVLNSDGTQNADKLRLQIASVDDEDDETHPAAGGLVGCMLGGSVRQSAATVYVVAHDAAGGLIGVASETTISDSYSGGRTAEGLYTDVPTAGVIAITNNSGVRVNVISRSGAAGGLVGQTEESTQISYSYSTASAAGVTAGGLIGSAPATDGKGGSVSFCYSSGKVFNLTDSGVVSTSAVYPFVGANYDKVNYSGKNYYLANVSDRSMDYTGAHYAALASVTSGSTEVTTFVVEKDSRQDAEVYDRTLLVDYAGKFFFPTIKQLHSLHSGVTGVTAYTKTSDFADGFMTKHYGDWQIPGLTPLYYTFVNEDTLFTDVTLESDTNVVTMAVYGEVSHNARIFYMDVLRDSSDNPTGLRLKREGIVTNGASGGVITWLSDATGYVFTIGTAKTVTENGSTKIYYELPLNTRVLSSDPAYSFRVTLDDITSFTQLFVKTDNSITAVNEAAGNLIPGENVTLLVGGGEGSWTELLSLKKTSYEQYVANLSSTPDGLTKRYNPCAKTTNSLFGETIDYAFYEGENEGVSYYYETASASLTGRTAKIVFYRHLQNLDVDISDFADGATAAQQLSLINGAALFLSDYKLDGNGNVIYKDDGSRESRENTAPGWYLVEQSKLGNKIKKVNGMDVSVYRLVTDKNGTTVADSSYGTKPLPFYGISNPYLTSLNGRNYTIYGMKIGMDGSGYAGFFRNVNTESVRAIDDEGIVSYTYTLNVSRLRLQDPIVSGSNSVGAVAAVVQAYRTLRLDTVLADGEAATTGVTSTGGSAGGLVGFSSGNINITNSAASLLVEAKRAAGGIIGRQASGTVTISKCYVGGHTEDGVYIKLDSSGNDISTYNIHSTGTDASLQSETAAGGFIGVLSEGASAKVEMSFNAASVKSDLTKQQVDADDQPVVDDEENPVMVSDAAGGVIGRSDGTVLGSGKDENNKDKLLDLVYVLAPVYGVETVEYKLEDETWVAQPVDSNAGSIIGLSSNQDLAEQAGSYYFLQDTYVNPAPVTQGNNRSNIKGIGSFGVRGILEKLASYYINDGSDDILGTIHTSELVDMTDPFDPTLKGNDDEYPFRIWTSFAFEDYNGDYSLNKSDKIHAFYGDWQPVDNAPTKRLIVHFVTVIPADDTTGFEREIKILTTREIAVQMPYRKLQEVLLPYVPSMDGYESKEWNAYLGDWSDEDSWGDANLPPADKKLTSGGVGGQSVPLQSADVAAAVQAAKLADKKDLEITFVSQYKPAGNKIYKLVLHDIVPTATTPAYDNTDSKIYKVISLESDDVLLSTALNGKVPLRNRSVGDYRFRGWYSAPGAGTDANPLYCGSGNRYYYTYMASGTNSSTLQVAFNSTAFADKTIGQAATNGVIHLYAGYEAIPKQNLIIHFKLRTPGSSELRSLTNEGFTINFDAEKGLTANLPLPVDAKLKVDTGTSPNPASVKTESGVSLTLSGNPNDTLSVTVPPKTEGTAFEDIEYDVVFQGEETVEKVGYAIRYVMKDSKGNTLSDLEYDKNGEDKVLNISEGTTPRGKQPGSDDSTESTAFNALINREIDGFTRKTLPVKIYSSMTTAEQNTYLVPQADDPDPENAGKKIPYQITEGTGEDAESFDCVYVYVVEYTRNVYALNFDTTDADGVQRATIVDSKSVPYGANIKDYATDYPTYEGHSQPYWYLAGDSTKKDITTYTDNAEEVRMPAGQKTLKVEWGKKEKVDYQVAFFAENADNTKSAYLGSFKITKDKNFYNEVDTELNPDNWSQYISRNFGFNKNYSTNETEYSYNSNGTTFKLDLEHFYYDVAFQTASCAQYEIERNPRVSYDNSTVLNIYLKRKTYTLRFEEQHTYTENQNGIFGQLTSGDVQGFFILKEGTAWMYLKNGVAKEYTGSSFYVKTTEDSGTQYAADGTQLTTGPGKVHKTEYNYSRTESNSGTLYGVVKGEFVRIYWRNNRWRTGNNNNSPEYSGEYRYTQDTGITYYGTRYTRRGNNAPYTYTAVDSSIHTGNQYGVIDDGHVKLNYVDGTIWIKDDLQYDGDRFKTTGTPTGEVFALVDGQMVLLTKQLCNGKPYFGSKFSRDDSIPQNNSTSYNMSYTSIRIITAKWESDIKDYFPEHPVNTYAYRWEDDRDYYGYPLVTQDRMPDMDLTFTPQWEVEQGWWSTSYTYKGEQERKGIIHYYVEALPNDTEHELFSSNITSLNGRKFYELKHAYHAFNYLTYNEEYHSIIGFTRNEYYGDPNYQKLTDYSGQPYGYRVNVPYNGGLATNKFYYLREQYTLEMRNPKSNPVTYDVLYDDSLSRFNTQPTNPYGNDYRWVGWCTDATLNNLFDFSSERMPAGNLVLYAKWELKPKSVEFIVDKSESAGEDLEGSELIEPEEEGEESTLYHKVVSNIKYGTSIEETVSTAASNYNEMADAYKATKSGWTFKYWYYTANGERATASNPEIRYLPTKKITADLKLYPHFEKDPVPDYASATVVCYACDPNTFDKLPDTTTEDPDDYIVLTPTAEELGKLESYIKNKQVGTGVTVPAPAIVVDGKTYLAAYETYEWFVTKAEAGQADPNVIEFLYYLPAEWQYKVNYVVTYPSVYPASGAPSWITADEGKTFVTNAQKPYTVSLTPKTENGSGTYSMVTYSAPAGLGTGYRFEKFVDQSGKETTDPFVLVFKGKANTVPEITVYLVPDEESFGREDAETQFTNTPHGMDSGNTGALSEAYSGLPVPAGEDSPVIHYSYTGSTNAAGQPVNVGVYGVHMWVTLTVDDDVYVLWQSETAADAAPTTHFYITPGDVTLISDSAHFFRSQQDYNKLMSAAWAGWRLDDVEYGYGVSKSFNVTVDPTTAPVPTINFSAEAFRSTSSIYVKEYDEQGKPKTYGFSSTPNVFTFSGASANYNYFKVFGELYYWRTFNDYKEYVKAWYKEQDLEPPVDPDATD